jgi:hypothetical protein
MLVGRGELLLFMDADGATRVSDVEKLEAALSQLSSARAPANTRAALTILDQSAGQSWLQPSAVSRGLQKAAKSARIASSAAPYDETFLS